MKATLVLLLVGAGAIAQADPIVLRIATVAPEGSIWAREIHNFSNAYEESTHGQVKIKWYMNGVAGDELEQGERIRAGQLDGSASGQMLCERVAPSMRVARLAGVFQNRQEAFFVMNQLEPIFEKEGAKNGFAFLGAVGLGPVVIFSREPVASLADLRRYKFWKWDVDVVGIATSRALGVQIVSTPLYEAGPAYEQQRVDGFLTVPIAALSFQWSPMVHYVTNLTESYLWGCLVIAQPSFARMSYEEQQALKASGASLQARLETVTTQLDEELLGKLFAKQGLKNVPVSDSFRAQFFAAARGARDTVAKQFVAPELVDRVLRLLADYRAEHERAKQ